MYINKSFYLVTSPPLLLEQHFDFKLWKIPTHHDLVETRSVAPGYY